MLSAELLAQIRGLAFRAGYLASDALLGEYASAFKGQGWDFEEVRSYQHGDDLRSVDWPVTARMGEPFVKVFREERELTLLLLVDVSASLDFGSHGRPKRERAAELAAVLAFLATKTHDKVGLVLFSEEIEAYIAPGKGKSHIWNIIRAVMTHKAKGRKTKLDDALRFVLNTRKRRALCILISDFWARDYEGSLQQLARQHQLVCARLLDKREQQWPKAGLLWLEDKESGGKVLIDSSSAVLQNAWREERQKALRDWERWVQVQGAYPLSLQEDEGTVEALHRLLRSMDRGRRRR